MEDRPHCPPARLYGPERQAKIVLLACQSPASQGWAGQTHWSTVDLAQHIREHPELDLGTPRWTKAEGEHGETVEEAVFCTHAALVEVDAETGQVSVLDYVAAQDVGFALNRLSVEGQIQGSVIHGLGFAVSEELVVEQRRVVNPTYTDYHMPAADTAPPVHAIIVERPSDATIFGARGVGEASMPPRRRRDRQRRLRCRGRQNPRPADHAGEGAQGFEGEAEDLALVWRCDACQEAR